MASWIFFSSLVLLAINAGPIMGFKAAVFEHAQQRYVLMALMVGCSLAWERDYYTAAVYEHSRLGSDYSNVTAVIKPNLEYYERAAKAAKKTGADIILFPEYGLFPPLNRSQIKGYLESVPDPKKIKANPCNDKDLFADRPILLSLSCMAKMNNIVVVANMGGIEKCTNATDCPEDGDLHLNANVAFDHDGTLIARYYKEHLFFELGMDLPREVQNPVFDTQFGKFAMFICFDIIFEKMTMVSQLEEVDAMLFSTMWMNTSPFDISTQFWQAWAIGNNATLLSANIQIPGYLATGSGIYRGRKGPVVQTLNPDGISKLIVAKIPKHYEEISQWSKILKVLENGTEEWKDTDQDMPEVCSYGILGPSENIYKDYRCWDEKVLNYTLVKLEKSKDQLEVCNNHMCCALDYVANNMNESFYLGVFNGTHNAFNRYFWEVEKCFLARCDDVNGTACSTFPMVSHTLFYSISLVANFSTKHVYPSLVGNKARLIPLENWNFRKNPEWSSVSMFSETGTPLISATLKGRAYHRDPPYIR